MIAQPGRLVPSIVLVFVAAALVGCSGQPVATQTPDRSSPGERAAVIALDQVGIPYRYGGNSPRGFDCSGLVQYSYGTAGVAVPRTTGQLWSAARPVDERDMRAGDLLFFRIEGKMSHVGLYLGKRRFVHAPQSGRSVAVASLESPFYRTAFIRAGRVY
jgi:cell wall-associated NlpC family hydrolase